MPACPALDPVEEPALEPVDPAEPADPAEPDCPVSATTQHVKSNKTAIIEIFVFMGPPSLRKEVTPNPRSPGSVGCGLRTENPVDALGFAGRCGRNSGDRREPPRATASRPRDKPADEKKHPTIPCLPGNVAAQL